MSYVGSSSENIDFSTVLHLDDGDSWLLPVLEQSQASQHLTNVGSVTIFGSGIEVSSSSRISARPGSRSHTLSSKSPSLHETETEASTPSYIQYFSSRDARILDSLNNEPRNGPTVGISGQGKDAARKTITMDFAERDYKPCGEFSPDVKTPISGFFSRYRVSVSEKATSLRHSFSSARPCKIIRGHHNKDDREIFDGASPMRKINKTTLGACANQHGTILLTQDRLQNKSFGYIRYLENCNRFLADQNSSLRVRLEEYEEHVNSTYFTGHSTDTMQFQLSSPEYLSGLENIMYPQYFDF